MTIRHFIHLFTDKIFMKFVMVGIINTINILTCYLLAYGIAKTLIKWILSDFSTTYQENIAMIIGMCLFVVFNYLGKRFFTFKHKI